MGTFTDLSLYRVIFHHHHHRIIPSPSEPSVYANIASVLATCVNFVLLSQLTDDDNDDDDKKIVKCVSDDLTIITEVSS